MPKFLLVLFLMFAALVLKAQTWEIGGSAGGAGYMGDLNQNDPVKLSGFSLSAFAKRNFNGYLSVKVAYTIGSISAADSTSSDAQFRARNLSFTTSLYEASATGEFNFMEYIPQIGQNSFTPFIYLGFAAVNYFPTAVVNGQKYSLRQYHTEGESKPYPTMAFSVPYGAGIKYNIFGKWTITADIGYRNPNTDYLDDVSGNYPPTSKSNLQLTDRSGEKTGNYIGLPGTQRGDGNPRDTYWFAQVGLSFTFISQKCYFH